jgi:predicted nucleotidyltransferase
MKSAPEIIVEGLERRGIDVLLVGGMALPAYGVVRQTLDIDCLIAEEHASALGEVLKGAGYSEQARSDNFIRYTGPEDEQFDVDVLLVDTETMSELVSESRAFDLGPATMRVPSLRHLVMLKLHAIKNEPKRELRDLSDVVEMLRFQPDSISTEELAEICARYGPPGILDRLKDAL